MSSDLTTMESALSKLRPTSLDAALLARLEACAADTWSAPPLGDDHLARPMATLAPAKMPSALMVSLEAIVSTVDFPGEQNILSFPNSQLPTARHPRAWWSAAAAVALIGAITALIIPTHHGDGNVAATSPHSHVALPAQTANHLVPAGFNRGLTEAHDEGVIWPSHDQAQRVLKVVYTDRVTLKDSSGRTYQVDQPRIEYILVPAKAD